MALKDWAERKNRELRRKSLEDRDARLWHSGAYHDYFEGYTERTVTDGKGKTKIERVYTADWYRQDVSQKQYVGIRVLYAFLFLVLAGCMVGAGIFQGSAGTAFYIVLPEIVTICLLARLFYVLAVNYLFLPRKMTVHDYKASHEALQRASLWLAFGFGADFLLTILDVILIGGQGRFRNIYLALLFFLLGAALSCLMTWLERKIPYTKEKNKQTPPEGGVTIDNEKSVGLFRRWTKKKE